MVNKSMHEVWAKHSEEAKKIVENTDSHIRLVLNKQWDLMNKIIEDYDYKDDKGKKLLINSMILSLLDEWAEYDYEDNNFEKEFELIDMIHFIIQVGYLVIKEYHSNPKDIIDTFQELVMLNEDSFLDFMNRFQGHFKPTTAANRYERYSGNFKYKFVVDEDMVYLIRELLDYVHWKTWKKYKEYSEFEVKSILKILQTLFFAVMERLNVLEDFSVDFSKNITVLYVVKNFENFDRQDRGY